MLIGAYVAQYVLFMLSWWLLGHGVLNGTIDRGWLLGWLLLLASLIPVRLVATWNGGGGRSVGAGCGADCFAARRWSIVRNFDGRVPDNFSASSSKRPPSTRWR